MGSLVFIPSYNDSRQAVNLARQAATYSQTDRVLIIDDSDDPQCISYLNEQPPDPRVTLIQRTRSGKWSAWRTTLQQAPRYDNVIQVDSDVTLATLNPLLHALRSHDVVTAHPHIQTPPGATRLAREVTEAYRLSHTRLKAQGKFNMGGQVIGLSRQAAESLLSHGFFTEPVAADDHVIALAGKALGLRCTTVDIGMQVSLPGTLRDWVRYKSRHRGAIRLARRYVAEKTGRPAEVDEASRRDYRETVTSFLAATIGGLKLWSLVGLVFLEAASLLGKEDRTVWTRLESTKPA